MRLSLSVSGSSPIVASLSGPGYLSTHLTMTNRPNDNEYSKNVRAVGIETREKETVFLKWPVLDLTIGDVVEVKILPDGEGDLPTENRSTFDAPSNLFSSAEMAKELLQAVAQFEQHIGELMRKSEEIESADEHKKFRSAWASTVFELGQNLLYPVYRRHTELIPEEMKGELL